jgi:hypothetical protein
MIVFLVLLVLPAVDLPETNFDEANTPTNEMVAQRPCPSSESILSLKAFVSGIFVHTRKTRVSNARPLDPPELTYSLRLSELFRTLRC